MAPRPEYESVKQGNVSSSDDDCAMLVKPGQLNTFKYVYTLIFLGRGNIRLPDFWYAKSTITVPKIKCVGCVWAEIWSFYFLI